MSMAKKLDRTNIFVSHYHEDERQIKALKSLMGEHYEMKNSSVTSEKFNRAKNPDYIKSLLKPLISWAGTFICLIGENTHNSEWVDWEIRQAGKMGKRIIGVYCHGATDADVPDALEEFADAIVGWRKDKISSAISGESYFEKADGSVRPFISMGRSTC